MKAIYNRKLTNNEKKACKRYIVEEIQKGQNESLMRFLKVNCMILHDDFGFGYQRLAKFINCIRETMGDNVGNEIFWDKVDEIVIDNLKLPFERENYEEREQAMKENAKRRNI